MLSAYLRFGAALLKVAGASLAILLLGGLIVVGCIDDGRCRERWPGSHVQWGHSGAKWCVRDQTVVDGVLP